MCDIGACSLWGSSVYGVFSLATSASGCVSLHEKSQENLPHCDLRRPPTQSQAKEAERLQVERDELVKDKKLLVERVAQLEQEIEQRSSEKSLQHNRITALLAEQVRFCSSLARVLPFLSSWL